MSPSNENRPAPILIRDDGHIQVFRWPDTGEEFTSTINRPIPANDNEPATVSLRLESAQSIEIKKLVVLATLLNEVSGITSRELLQQIREERAFKVLNVPRWKAEGICKSAKQEGILLTIDG